jgi:N-acetylneuraminic acid mutarotase
MKSKKIFILLFISFFTLCELISQTNYSYPARKSQKVFVFQDKLFLVGGIKNEKASGIIYSNDIWISNFGDFWVNLVKDPVKPRRNKFSSTVFREKIFIIGGYDELTGRYLNDVWFTEDGVKWVKSVPNSNFRGRG